VTSVLPREPAARRRRLAAGALAGLLVLAAIVLGALRLLVAQLPQNAARVQAWIEQQTRLRIEYRALDARLRWFGPEVVMRDLRVLDRDGTQALFAAREGAVGLDLWNLFRTGQLVAGRVRFVGPDITLVRLADGRIRLLGQRERPVDRPPFDLDRLPAGRVVVEDARITYRDLRSGAGPWTLEDLQLTLRRDRAYVTTEGSARLPAKLGGRMDFSGRLRGSLDEFDKLQARVELRAARVLLPGWADLLPAHVARPRSGEGAVSAVVSVADGALSQARLSVDLADVTLEMPRRQVPTVATVQISEPYREPGATALRLPVVDMAIVDHAAPALPREVRYAVLAGDFRLRRDQGSWHFRVSDLRTGRGSVRVAQDTRIAGRLRGNLVSTFDLDFDASGVRIAQIWPLVLAFAPPGFDRWAGLDPTGEIRSLHLQVQRPRAGARPEFAVSADVAELGVQPIARWPGLSGITAVLSGTDERGRIGLRAGAAALHWPRLFRAPLAVQRASANVDWRRDGATWVFASKAVSVEHGLAKARGSFEISIPRKAMSPVLTLTARVEASDVSIVSQVLPVGRLKPRTLAWLERAFLRGRLTSGQLSYHGPVRQFPFRNGEGDFTASADVSGATLDYFTGFAPLTGAVGRVEFHNAGMRADVRGGQIAGLNISRGEYSVADLKAPVMKVEVAGSGDLARALAYLQGSPLGPQLGRFVMGLTGNGPADYDVSLTIPAAAADVQSHDYIVRTNLKSVTLGLPALRAPAQKVTGVFELHNFAARADSLRGTILGGPFELSVAPGALGGDVSAAIELRGRGRASGSLLPAFSGLPAAIRMNGAADWELTGRLERRSVNAQWPLRIDVASSLTGLEILAPQPFAKAPAESRTTRVRLEIPSAGLNDVSIESGSARAKLRFNAEDGGKWTLERGLARFDGQPVALPSRPGLMVAGDWPQFDLGEWLALRSGSSSGPRLSEWLGPVDVHLDRAVVAGFEFRDVIAHLRAAGDEWQVAVQGPMAEGDVTIPDDLAGGRPIVLQMQRLSLQSPPVTGGKAVEESDPRTMPALAVQADDFVWQSRRFGTVRAAISKTAQGLRFDSLTASAPTFSVNGRGSWLADGRGWRTRLEFELASTDLAATCAALGYREVVEAGRANLTANLQWDGGPSADAIGRMDGTLRIALDEGQLRDVKPGAGRMLGLMSIVELPRRLALDFRDVTEKGLAFDKVRGDFELRKGNAYTQNLLLKGAAVDIGVVGRTGLATEDYDQTVIVSGNPSGPLTVAGALAAGPVVGAGVLVLAQLFKGQLQGLTRAYYHVSGPWSNPVVQRISAPADENAAAGSTKGGGGSP